MLEVPPFPLASSTHGTELDATISVQEGASSAWDGADDGYSDEYCELAVNRLDQCGVAFTGRIVAFTRPYLKERPQGRQKGCRRQPSPDSDKITAHPTATSVMEPCREHAMPQEFDISSDAGDHGDAALLELANGEPARELYEEAVHEVRDDDKAMDPLVSQRVLVNTGGEQHTGTVADIHRTSDGVRLYLIIYDDGDVEHLLHEVTCAAVAAFPSLLPDAPAARSDTRAFPSEARFEVVE